MPNRAQGEGSVCQRSDGRWQASLQVDGKRATVYGRTRGEVVEKLRAVSEQARRNGNRLASAGKLTVADYLAEWLEQAEGRLRPGTLASYQTLASLHVNPSLGSVPLAKLDALRLARHYARLGKTLSGRRVQMVHRLLHKALADAQRWGLLASNPAALVDSPKAEPREPTLWAPEEAGRFVRAMLDGEGGQHGNLFAFLLASGCRGGEAFGLRWSDVDLTAGTVRIERQITFCKNKPVESAPKSKAGRRSIALPPWGVETLKRQKAQVAGQRLRAGNAWAGGEHVFTTEHGTTPTPTNLRRAFLAACDRLGLPRLRVHDLRHLSLSLLAMNGVPLKVAQQRAGHSSPMLTARVYQHVLGDADRQAAEALARALGG